MTTTQPTLFEIPQPKRCRACGNRCATCGATPPDEFDGMWLEPVSQECRKCNHETLDGLMRALREGLDATPWWQRHHRTILKRTTTRKARR